MNSTSKSVSSLKTGILSGTLNGRMRDKHNQVLSGIYCMCNLAGMQWGNRGKGAEKKAWHNSETPGDSRVPKKALASFSCIFKCSMLKRKTMIGSSTLH